MNFLRFCLLLPCLVAFSFADDSPTNAMQAAERVILPKVDFREASLEEAAEFLTQVNAKEPTRLNIILAVPPDPRPKITLQKQNQNLLATLKEAAAQAGCEVQGEAHALVVRAKGAPPLPPIAHAAGLNGKAIRKKLDQIVVPGVYFRETTLRDAIEFLIHKMKQLDPDGAGVSVVLKMDDQVQPAAKAGDAAADVPGIPGLPQNAPAPSSPAVARAPAPAPPGIPGLPDGNVEAPAGVKRISLQAANIPILELFRYVAGLADLQVTIQDFAVVITRPRKK